MLRFVGRMLSCLAMAALLCLVCSGLVTTSVRAEAPEEREVPVQATLRCDADLPVPQPAAHVQQRERAGTQTASVLPRAEEAPTPVLCDANGCPLTGRTWVRAAWAANPPESIPGS